MKKEQQVQQKQDKSQRPTPTPQTPSSAESLPVTKAVSLIKNYLGEV